MTASLNRLLKLAEIYFTEKDEKSFNLICVQFDSYIKKHGHMEPRNDGTTPNPWKRNMDYSGYENSPYFGSVSEFLKKFPGGIRDWVVWRNKTKKQRNQMYSDLLPKSKTEKKAHYEPVGGDDVDRFEKEQPLYSDRGLEKFKSIQDFLKQYHQEGQSADDAARKAVEDMISYWKLLRKSKKRRKGKKD